MNSGRDPQEFADRVRDRDVTVAIVGLGYVGLPLAMAFEQAGLTTLGLDNDERRVEALRSGRSHVDDVPDSMISAADGFEVTADASLLSRADAIFLCVPTPFDAAKTPVLDYVRAASATVGRQLRDGQLVILQSTTYPGTTTEVVQPILEAESGLRAGIDFHLAYSPERVDPGNATWTLANTPKVCGGITPECGERTRVLLTALLDDPTLVKVVSSPKIAEMSKLAENTYRAVNIAYVNELAMLTHEMDVDIWEVMEAAATKPFGFQPFMPGIGPGGQCIPVNPYYISWKAREFDFHTSFIELAGDINLRMTNYVMHRIHSFATRRGLQLNGARVLCLGAAFKASVSDVRNSRVVRVMELLDREGAHLSFADPLVATLAVGDVELTATPLDTVDFAEYDLVIVLVRNPAWPVDAVLASGVPTFDAVNALDTPSAGHHERL